MVRAPGNRARRDGERGAGMLNTITTGDARVLSQQIPDESIDLIFTDPPYLEKYLPLYDWLGSEARRMLKPGGFLLTYAGTYHKPQVMGFLGSHLSYYWDFVSMHPGENSIVWQRKIIARCKFILAYVKGDGRPWLNVLGAWIGGGADKRYHVWGQDESTARYYIDCFSKPGTMVLDPFLGGGTTAAICKQLGRNFIGFEIDPATADIARKRLETVQPLLMPQEAEQLTLEVGA